jgi:hypothetical protein
VAVDDSHEVLADRLRARVGEAGSAAVEVRAGAFALGGGVESSLSSPVGDLARSVAAASFRVTDAMVADVREALGSDVATFEVVMSASVGAGLTRWDAASRAIREAADAAS